MKSAGYFGATEHKSSTGQHTRKVLWHANRERMNRPSYFTLIVNGSHAAVLTFPRSDKLWCRPSTRPGALISQIKHVESRKYSTLSVNMHQLHHFCPVLFFIYFIYFNRKIHLEKSSAAERILYWSLISG